MLTLIARRHLINRKTTNHFTARAPLFATSRRMASFTVKQGLNLESRVPDAQMLIIGRKSLLKDLALKGPLVEKLKPVDEAIFKHAIDHINSGNGSASLFTDLIKIVSVPEELSRHNTPSNAYAILKEVKSTKLVKGIKKLNILLYTDYQSSMASIVAIARAFPLFSMKSKNESSLESVEVELMLDSSEKSFADNEVTFLQTLCDNVRTCCRLVDTPASILHTEALLDEALKMVDETGVPITKTIIKGRELLDKGFGGIYSVGQAAKRPPIFACFSHTPAGATHRYALVGKGIVYDTGGLSLKGKTMMPSMKIDMGGAAAVLSAFSTLVKAGFTENLHCLMCIAENHISPEATRPDDIIKMLSGKTVEVNNTDAEGRLVLADGVYYAKTTLKADTIIDMATLTGAQAMATGKYHAAIVCNSDALEEQCVRAGRKSGELVHPLPFVPELHFSDLGSKVADMKNAVMGTSTGPPTAVAGLFIGAHIDFGQQKEQQQKEDGSQKVNWLHIDMAGLTGLEKWDGRATGYGVALLCSLLANHTNIGVAKMQQ